METEKDWSVQEEENQKGVMPWKPRKETISRRRRRSPAPGAANRSSAMMRPYNQPLHLAAGKPWVSLSKPASGSEFDGENGRQ